MKNKRKYELSSIDMATILMVSLLGVRVLTLPRDLSDHTELGAWVSVIIGGVIVLILSLMIYRLGIKHPGENGSEIVMKLFGKYLGPVGILAISIYTLGSLGLGGRLFLDSIRIYLLPNTPSIVVAIIMIAASFYTFNLGLRAITSLINILLPQILLFIVFLLTLPLTRVNMENFINPFGLGITPIFKGSFEVLDALYGFVILTYLMPHFKEPKSAKKWIVLGVGMPTLIYFGIVILCILVFSDAEMGRMLYPTVTLVKSIQIQGELFERAESLLISLWVIIIYFTMVLSFYMNYQNIKALIKMKKGTLKDKIARYGQASIVLGVAMLPENVVQQEVYETYIGYVGRVLMLGLIPALVMLTFLRERKKEHGK